MIHPNKPVNLSDLPSGPIEAPNRAGGYWEPIPHEDLIKEMLKASALAGCVTDITIGGLSKDGLDLAVSFTYPDLHVLEGVLSLGILNSNSRRFALRGYAGVVSSNNTGIPLLSLPNRKHTSNISIADIATANVSFLTGHSGRMQQTITRLKQSIAKPAEWTEKARYAARPSKYIAWTKLGKVLNLFDEAKDKSAWDFLCCFAEIAKQGNVFHQMDQIYHMLQIMEGRA